MGYRVVAIDGSTLTLPQQAALTKHFGIFKGPNNSDCTAARTSVAYDVCNHLMLDASINKVACSELDMAKGHLSSLNPLCDLLLFDRGYPSIAFAIELQKKGFHFCFRLATTWKEAYTLLEGTDDTDWIIKKGKRYQIGNKNKGCLCEDLKGFRIVKILLDNGEYEVLLTNLSDRNLYPLDLFKELYHLRWAVEECYKRIKQISQVEFFSGRTLKAIQQDFHARIVLLNMAAMIEMQQLQPYLDLKKSKRSCKHKLQVNRVQVSAKLKAFLYDIMYGINIEREINKMLKLLGNAYDIVRDNRHFHRKRSASNRKPLNYKGG